MRVKLSKCVEHVLVDLKLSSVKHVVPLLELQVNHIVQILLLLELKLEMFIQTIHVAQRI